MILKKRNCLNGNKHTLSANNLIGLIISNEPVRPISSYHQRTLYRTSLLEIERACRAGDKLLLTFAPKISIGELLVPNSLSIALKDGALPVALNDSIF